MLYCLVFNTNISECFGVNLRTVQRIRKEFGESNSDYEGTVVRKPTSGRSDKKRTLEFVDEVQAMIDNDPSKSIKSTTKDIGVFEFLIRQVLYEDICVFVWV